MRGKRRGRPGAALILAGSLAFAGLGVGMARATSSLDEAVAARRHMGSQLVVLHHRLHVRRLRIQARIEAVRAQLPGSARVSRGDASSTFRALRRAHRAKLVALRRHQRDVIAGIKAHKAKIRGRKDLLAEWIRTYGIFRFCPVAGAPQIADNFGVVVNIPGVPPHIHQGNDIAAATGTPIVAPFAGEVVATPNDLGGMAVEVRGEDGYVYDAHLSAYGALGTVPAGAIVGYVGSTGDARGPHDHFEWHPGNGAAVDPYPFLAAVC